MPPNDLNRSSQREPRAPPRRSFESSMATAAVNRNAGSSVTRGRLPVDFKFPDGRPARIADSGPSRAVVFCVGLFPENECRFFLNDGGRDPIISGPSVVQNRFMLAPNSAWCPVSAVQPSVQAPQPLTPPRPGKNAEHTQGRLAKKWGAENPGQRLKNFSDPIFLPKRLAV